MIDIFWFIWSLKCQIWKIFFLLLTFQTMTGTQHLHEQKMCLMVNPPPHTHTHRLKTRWGEIIDHSIISKPVKCEELWVLFRSGAECKYLGRRLKASHTAEAYVTLFFAPQTCVTCSKPVKCYSQQKNWSKNTWIFPAKSPQRPFFSCFMVFSTQTRLNTTPMNPQLPKTKFLLSESVWRKKRKIKKWIKTLVMLVIMKVFGTEAGLRSICS